MQAEEAKHFALASSKVFVQQEERRDEMGGNLPDGEQSVAWRA